MRGQLKPINLKLLLGILIFLTSFSSAVEFKQHWNDTVKVCIIWNSETRSDGMPSDWQQATGEIGETTRKFVEKAIETIPKEQISIYSGRSPQWNKMSKDVESFRKELNDTLPHVIVYINAGYEWSSPNNPTEKLPGQSAPLFKQLSDLGVGIVAVGDDAAYDAQSVFELTGYKQKGNIIQVHGYDDDGGLPAPYMVDGVTWVEDWDNGGWKPDSGYQDLRIILNHKQNKKLPDYGLLSHVEEDTLLFKEWAKNERGQADADVWDIDTNTLDKYAPIGTQEGMTQYDGMAPPSNMKDLYKVLAALQYKLNRVVMLGYQPQYLENEKASLQIVYNSLYWASKAHEMLRLPKPEADPSEGSPNIVGPIELTVDQSVSKSLYTIWYTLNGDDVDTTDKDCIKYDKKFTLIDDGNDVVLKAVAFPTNGTDWTPSDTLKITYEYAHGPEIDSAFLYLGAVDRSNSARYYPDTLKLKFDKEIEKIDEEEPFNSYSANGNYSFKLKFLEKDGKWARFEVLGFNGQDNDYTPKDREDIINVKVVSVLLIPLLYNCAPSLKND